MPTAGMIISGSLRLVVSNVGLRRECSYHNSVAANLFDFDRGSFFDVGTVGEHVDGGVAYADLSGRTQYRLRNAAIAKLQRQVTSLDGRQLS